MAIFAVCGCICKVNLIWLNQSINAPSVMHPLGEPAIHSGSTCMSVYGENKILSQI
jgi:hypothetical protein